MGIAPNIFGGRQTADGALASDRSGEATEAPQAGHFQPSDPDPEAYWPRCANLLSESQVSMSVSMSSLYVSLYSRKHFPLSGPGAAHGNNNRLRFRNSPSFPRGIMTI